MATTITKKDPDITMGNLKAKIYTLAGGASDTSMSVPTGLDNVVFAI